MVLASEEATVEDINDVARFYLLLCPNEDSESSNSRLLIMTSKMLPSPIKHERRGSFVDMVSSDRDEILRTLQQHDYKTSKSEMTAPASRVCGEGLYEFVQHDNGDVHFIYELEVPHEPGPAQKAFNIQKTASYLVSVKNPSMSPPPHADAEERRSGLGPSQKASLPASMKEHFRGKRVEWTRWGE